MGHRHDYDCACRWRAGAGSGQCRYRSRRAWSRRAAIISRCPSSVGHDVADGAGACRRPARRQSDGVDRNLLRSSTAARGAGARNSARASNRRGRISQQRRSAASGGEARRGRDASGPADVGARILVRDRGNTHLENLDRVDPDLQHLLERAMKMARADSKRRRAVRRRGSNIALLLSLALALSGCKGELYSRLSEKEANLIIALLLRSGIAADRLEAKDGSNTVRVEQDRFADAVTLLNASGLPRAKFENMGSVFSSNGLVS